MGGYGCEVELSHSYIVLIQQALMAPLTDKVQLPGLLAEWPVSTVYGEGARANQWRLKTS